MTDKPQPAKNPEERAEKRSRGAALVVVLLVMAIFLAATMAVLFSSGAEHVVATNEQDHLKALGFTEAAIAWAERRVLDAGNLSDLLDGPDDGSGTDDNLIGLRDLSLTASTQFLASNQDTASAIVQRDFGDGNQRWEVLRIPEDASKAALVYVRLDDNFDDDPNDPTNDDPLTDNDGRVSVTAVAEYPVFLDALGIEQPNRDLRGRAVRRVKVEFFGENDTVPAVGSSGDIEISGSPQVCGACGDVHSNGDLIANGQVCQDATASGAYSGGASVGGVSGGGFPPKLFPVISPYDDLWVPDVTVFDQGGCGAASSTDAGNSKYFALVADDDKGLVYKAYWDFTRNRWGWYLIDDLSDTYNRQLDACGRSNLDANYAGGVNDGKDDEFYGFKLADTEQFTSCPNCGSSDADASLCTLANNDFTLNGYYVPNTAIPVSFVPGSSFPAFPGSLTPDGNMDFDPVQRLNSGRWDHAGDTVWSTVEGAVIFIYGNFHLSGSPGTSANPWNVTLAVYGSAELSDDMDLAPANTAADYWLQIVAGRDLKINGNPNAGFSGCGSGCATGAPAAIAERGGYWLAHEQIRIGGNATIFGILFAEDAVECADMVDEGRGVFVDGDPQVFYDCEHPPNLFGGNTIMSRTSWQELD